MQANPVLTRYAQYAVIAVAFCLPISIAAMYTFLGIAFLLMVFSGHYLEKIRCLQHNPLTYWSLLIVSIFFLGISYSSASYQDAISMALKYNKFIYLPLLFPLMLDEDMPRKAIYALIAGTAVLALIAYLKWFGYGMGSHPEGIKNHIDASFSFAFAAFLLGHLMIESRFQQRVWIVLFVLIVFCLYFINTGRSGQLMFAVLSFWYGMRTFGYRGGLFALLGLGLLWSLAIAFSPSFNAVVNRTLHNYMLVQQADDIMDAPVRITTSIGQRVTFVENSWDLFLRHPWVGTGTGSFAGEYKRFVLPGSVVPIHPHNEYLQFVLQLGLLGLLLLVLFFTALWFFSYRLPAERQLLAQSVLVTIAIGCLTNSWLLDAHEGYFFIYFVALCYAGLGKTPHFARHMMDASQKVA